MSDKSVNVREAAGHDNTVKIWKLKYQSTNLTLRFAEAYNKCQHGKFIREFNKKQGLSAALIC